MSTMLTGKIIQRKSAYIYLDTTGDGKADKSIFCDRDVFVKIPRYGNRRFSYYDAYAVTHPGDTISFPVNLAPEKLNKIYIVKPSDLAGEPIINGNNAFTLRLYRQMQEIQAMIKQDKTFSI